MKAPEPRLPALSVVVVTDRFATIAKLVAHLQAQTISDRLELVIACPARARLELDEGAVESLAATRVVEVGSVSPMSAAKVAGLRSTTAPLVFVGETHSFPEPEWAEALVAAHERGWSAVAPVFTNANPDGAISWSNLLLDYGRWAAPVEPGEIDEVPIYNASYRRSVLLAYDESLGSLLRRGGALETGTPLSTELRRLGHRLYREPAARMAHVNVSRGIVPWLAERFLAGRLFGANRSRLWPAWRRVAYIAGSPLIPAVYLWRTLRATRFAGRFRHVPLLTLPAMIVGTLVWAAGEAVGYALGEGGAEPRMTEIEVNKCEYAKRVL